MKVSLETIRTWVAQCDPQKALDYDDPRYVPLDEGEPVRGAARQSCIDELHTTIRVAGPLAQTCQLFTGFSGAGKTTELKRLEHDLEDDADHPTKVVYVDFDRYVDRYTPITVLDVLRVLAFSLDREADVAEDKDPDQRASYLKRLWKFLTSDVELKAIGFESYGVSLMAEIRDNPTVRDKINRQLALRFQAFAREAGDVMHESIVRIREARDVKRVVIVADGLEKLTPLDPESRDAVESSVETVFIQHARYLRAPCHVIYTFPLWLRYRTPGLANVYDAPPLVLPMVKIRERSGAPSQAGINKLRELVAKRVDTGQVFDNRRDDLLTLIQASGGYVRDLLRIVRDVVRRGERTGFPVGEEQIAQVVGGLGEDYRLVVDAGDLDLLAEIAEKKELVAPDGARNAALGRLLDRWIVLSYRNGEAWYDLHPMVETAPLVRDRLASRSTDRG